MHATIGLEISDVRLAQAEFNKFDVEGEGEITCPHDCMHYLFEILLPPSPPSILFRLDKQGCAPTSSEGLFHSQHERHGDQEYPFQPSIPVYSKNVYIRTPRNDI